MRIGFPQFSDQAVQPCIEQAQFRCVGEQFRICAGQVVVLAQVHREHFRIAAMFEGG